MNITPEDREYKIQLDMEVIVSEDDKAVYVKFHGFDTLEEADVYADYLTENLPFLLYQSNQRH
jgi:hypothetical protein